MSQDTEDLATRLAALEATGDKKRGAPRPSPLTAILGVAGIVTVGGLAWAALQPSPEAPLPTAAPEEFQTTGSGFGDLAPMPVTETPTDRSWRMDETYIKVQGEWVYLYRAVDKLGKTLDFMLSKRRNKTAATKFFARALEVNGLPRKIVIDRSGANTAGITAVNRMLRSFGCPISIEMVRIKYLNNMIEQDHRTIKSAFGQCWGSSKSPQLQQRLKVSKWRT